TIKYQVSNTSPVLIKVYDIIGREVSVLVNEVKEPGTYQVSFDSKNLASGIYFYKMVAGDFTSVKKMNLLK
ncbi:MAG: T9SS type A sorting domain-containing protein, partial [Chlorobium sp.]|nr:T9SS type A sorting domain-containing protein [Chlorobium sp.]